MEWKQNADEVIVKLNLGSRNPKVEEVDSSFTDTSCVIKLPGINADFPSLFMEFLISM